MRNVVIFSVFVLLAATGVLSYSGKWTAIFGGGGGKSATGAGYTIEEIPIEKTIPPPDYNRQVKFAAGTSEEVKKAVMLNITDLTGRLKKSTLDSEAWLNLGTMYKIAGDYEGARVIWEYLSAVSPGNYPSFANLGNLYHHYLNDYQKAEQNYLRAIGNNRAFIDGYRSLYELYRYSYAAKASEAPKILLAGIAANPSSTDLLILLAGYYKEKDDMANARTYYEKALALAEKNGNTALAASLRAEIESLR